MKQIYQIEYIKGKHPADIMMERKNKIVMIKNRPINKDDIFLISERQGTGIYLPVSYKQIFGWNEK
jgi:hypothetical protein